MKISAIKGQWSVIVHSWQDTSVVANDHTICSLRLSEDEVTEDNQDECEAQQAANAKLIAAAPDLLKALQDSTDLLMARVCDFSADHPYRMEFNRRIEWNNEAIKKATE